tara:strand:- start:207 stop:1013 length:807 start_codon:yes stop_codon:yes gene_type:complete
MEKNKLEELLYAAINTSIKAGEEIMKIYNSNFEVEFKDDASPLTLADKESNNTILKTLSFFDIPFLSEEGRTVSYDERKAWNYLWIIDPLDGTKEFVKKNGEFTVNIALIKNQTPILGVIYCPASRDLYFSSIDIGAFKIKIDKRLYDLDLIIKEANKLPIKDKRSNYVVVGSRSHMSKETEDFFDKKKREYTDIEILAVGSSLKICMVAEGKADAYPRYAPTMEWDTAAGHAIANMCGCRVLEYKTGQEIKYNKKSLVNSWFLVTRS